jgi:hypothetical protein
MTTTWYYASFGKILPVQVKRFTDSSVWVRANGCKPTMCLQHSLNGSYYPTWAEAREHLITRCAAKIRSYRRMLATAENDLSKLLDMKGE